MLFDKYKIILTDCFDTLIFRSVNLDILALQWARLVNTKFPNICSDYHEILRVRKKSYENLEKERCKESIYHEITYKEWMESIYEMLNINTVSLSDFIEICTYFEVSLEKGCVYKNSIYLKWLKKEKNKGKEIILVSDYYLGEEYLSEILKSCGIDFKLFSRIIVSADTSVTKRKGDIYESIKLFGINPQYSVMIGDSRTADYMQAKRHLFASIYKPNYIHKIKNKIYALSGIEHDVQKRKIESLFKHDLPYIEYVFMIYVMAKRLYHLIPQNEPITLNFLSREGLILKKAYDCYSFFKPDCSVNSNYFYISRRSIQAGIVKLNEPKEIEKDVTIGEWLSYLGIEKHEINNSNEIDFNKVIDSDDGNRLKDNKDFRFLFKTRIQSNFDILQSYLSKFTTNGSFIFVDIGWRGTTQNLIEQYYNIPTEGYYLGIQRNELTDEINKRMHAIIFDERDSSVYNGYLNTNISLYEQILAASHGTVTGYSWEEGEISYITKWDNMEKNIYEEYIKDLQLRMLETLPGIIAWEKNEKGDRDIWYLSRLVLKGTLFGHGRRLKISQLLNNSFVTGIRGGTRGKIKYDYSDLHLGLDIFPHPERYMKYITKVQRVENLYNKPIIKCLYWMITPLFYGYTCLIQAIRNSLNSLFKRVTTI